MPTVSGISFNVNFNLTGAPTLVLTDTTTYPVGAIGIYTITQPDGYVRTGSYSTPDVTSSGGTLSYILRLSSTGGLQCGTYTIVYKIKTTDTVETTFTRTFYMGYKPVDLTLRESFDVFTPELKYFDDTIYTVSNYSNGSVTRAWSVVSTPTGTLTGSSSSIDIVYGGNYYDANYSVTLTSSLLYTHQTYAWLTVTESISKNVLTYAETPPTYIQIVGWINQLRDLIESLKNSCKPYADAKADFDYAQNLLDHILDKIKSDQTTNIYVDLKELIRVLHNNHIPTYTPTNLPIGPYDTGDAFSTATWGYIGGTITDQTDLVVYIANQIADGKYAVTIGNGVNTSYTITHNLNTYDVEVEIYEVSSGETVFANVVRSTVNQVVISFSSLSIPTTNQFRVVIMK